ncbi:MAG: putative transferase transmembrane protein [Candidatus Collierbacteria bacterium GW2011_GWB1_45_35]|uniref:Putative transferase transmembrane protein n=1 Tax=Candidatus Collierbacteria bacterium GW2011_GWB2_45_17 TaxID=1618388 RepID=A0A837ILN7_9BACT|nr:MAG: putative transferase transmembrane protein [Microgenomates group bacterium GW2011_GWC1_44_23]KKT95871.1 MAG: putative transferase transmembrane protein [Candidatus Collierbacteria bacterium GW2011_GWA1_45_15]KKU01025.1 MAG: putative transferase transmembrane protein [Candidatus Collierbacteria bacterium GW2011_GWB2_45_17]KKU05879.1 MAG: putative transferase transmembrane protein [Candidatus Collierbacteria bacterium GW2011_GWB1_45_35]KKU07855.1 MAG: putative transferase transmembrane pr
MKTSDRITKLDGLRGVLSIIVALNHSFLIVAIPSFANVWGENYLVFYNLQAKIQQLFMLIGNGGVAVTMFFIISGLVLGQSLSRTEMSFKGLTSFYVKRFLRLYSVYFLVIILTAVYMRLGFVYQIFPYASTWYHWWMNFQMTLKEFFYNLFFIHTYLGGVTWTLRVILIASLILPLFYTLTKRTGWLVDLLITTVLIVASFTILNIEGFRDLRYLYMFFLGLILPKFIKFFSDLPRWLISLSLPFLVILLFIIRYATDEYFGGVIESLISWLIIGTLVYSEKTKIFDFLSRKSFLFFGKISYSLYLIHFFILYLLARIMFQLLPNLPYLDNYLIIHLTLLFISLAIATLVSTIVHRFVEGPSLALSKAVSDRISKS